MRNAIVGMVIGVVIGVVFGATVVAPRLTPAGDQPRPGDAAGIERMAPSSPERFETAAAPAAGKTQDSDTAAAAASTGAGPQPAPATESKTASAIEPDRTPAPLAANAAEDPPRTGASPPAKPSPNARGSGEKVPATAEVAIAGVAATPRIERLAPAPEPVRWRMGSAYASTLPQLGTLAKKLDRDIWRVSDGTLEIKFHEPGALVPPLEMFDAVRAGVIEAAYSSPGFWGNKIPALQLFASVPFGPAAKEFLAWIYFGGGNELFEEIYHAHGIHSLFCGLIAPEASGWFRNRIRTVEDLKGLKMRFFGLGAKVMKRLGVDVAELTPGDIFMALEQGAIDAAEFSMPAIDLKLGLHRMAKNYYFPGWHQPTTLFELMINLDKWNGLTPTHRAQIEAVCGDIIRYGLAEGEAAQFAALKELQAQGVHIRRWPTEILEAMNAAWEDVARDEAKNDRTFRRVWRSLSLFRDNYAIWQELNRPH